MTATNRKGPIIDPGLCRCCGAMKKCRLLTVEYEWMGQKEIYSDMFVDCFGLMLSQLETEPCARGICATCVSRLRAAAAFRCQVLACEERLLHTTIHVHGDGSDIALKPEVVVKVEALPDAHHNDHSHHNDHDDHMDDRDDVDNESPKFNIKLELVPEGKPRRKRKLRVERAPRGRREPPAAAPPGYIDRSYKKVKVAVDKELNALKNAITIVESSFVCPFNSLFSDLYCAYCQEMFIDPDRLREHTLTHDPAEYKKIADSKKLIQIDVHRIDCRLCPKLIDDLEAFKTHITSAHGKVIHQETTNDLLKFHLKLGNISCTECGKSFSFFHALKKHMAEHFGTYICDVCGAHYFEERHLVIHKKKHTDTAHESYPCDECGKTFKSKNSRMYHIARIHKNEPAYPCNKCDEVLLSYYLRYKHKMEVHGELRTFPCEHCSKVYDSRKAMREHTRKNHLQVLKHQCNFCEKKFYLPSALKDHMTSHTGERNFRCEFCGKSYPRLRALRVHMQSHNSEKKFKCNLCSASYTQVNNFKNHMKSKHQVQDESFQL